VELEEDEGSKRDRRDGEQGDDRRRRPTEPVGLDESVDERE
jgi:hypothetical protein